MCWRVRHALMLAGAFCSLPVPSWLQEILLQALRSDSGRPSCFPASLPSWLQESALLQTVSSDPDRPTSLPVTFSVPAGKGGAIPDPCSNKVQVSSAQAGCVMPPCAASSLTEPTCSLGMVHSLLGDSSLNFAGLADNPSARFVSPFCRGSTSGHLSDGLANWCMYDVPSIRIAVCAMFGVAPQ